MTKVDTELFELCKKVYEATGWKDTHDRISSDQLGIHQIRNEGNEVLLGTKQVPLYTSDYLLEKLPKTIYVKGKPYSLELAPYHNGWLAIYDWGGSCPWDDYEEAILSDIPLKALLKLTLKLKEEGVI